MLKFIICSGTPREMGRQYGEQANEEIQRNLELFGQHWYQEKLQVFSNKVKQTLYSFLPDILEELKGIAEGAKVDFDQVLLTNHVDTFGENVERCTPIILRNSPDGTIIAKNNDSPTNENYSFIIRKCAPTKGIPFIQVTYAGWISGLDCMNAEGLANTHGSVGSIFDKSGSRVDIRLKSYQILHNCRTVDNFLAGLNENPLTGKGFNIAVGDASGNTAMLDAAVPFIAVSNRNKKFDYATNLYKSPGLENSDTRIPSKRDICIYRYGYLKWLEETNPPQNIDDLKKILSCHEPWAPCRHGGVHHSKTEWSMINLIKERKILITDGAPCENKYKEYCL